MSLIDWWTKDKHQLAEKQVYQVIAFAGDGRLGDKAQATVEFREFLRSIPSELLSKYASQCLLESFTDSGLALQDIVNEIGRRLAFTVTPGRYRGAQNQPGHDGVWADGSEFSFVIEVKTTDAYRIDLDTIADYRKALAKSGAVSLEHSSMLVVVGRQDTGGLETQIRGSRHAWDMRVISVDALLRMLRLKEGIDDPSILRRIHDILKPREFTKLDPIVEIAFAAMEDARQLTVEIEDGGPADDTPEKKFTPVAFHEQCISKVEQKLGVSLIKQSRASFASPEGEVRVLCSVSRFHERVKNYWFAFHPHQGEFLSQAPNAYIAFGCGDEETLFLIPFSDFEPRLSNMNRTELEDRYYWHVKIKQVGKSFQMFGRAGTEELDITKYRV